MNKAVEFCHWLKGCLDINIYPEELNKSQIEIINKKLDEVFQELQQEEYEEAKKPSSLFPWGSATSIVPLATFIEGK